MKLQHSTSKHQRRSKSQTSKLRRPASTVELGRWCFSIASILVLGILVSGCLSKKPINKESYAFDVPPAHKSVAATTAPLLALRPIFVAPPFDSPSLTYRTGDLSYERDPYAGFLVSPSDTLSTPIRAMLRNSGKFNVTDPDSTLRSQLELEISVTRMYGDFRDKNNPTAALEMRFMVSNSARKPLFQKTYSRRLPVKARTAAAVVSALNQALDEIVTQFASDFHQ
jgi:cholesterol transport system auxiliary component